MRRIGAALVSLCLIFGPSHAGAGELFVQAPGPKGALKGTLLSPGDKAPVILLLPGSGNVDRDGNGGPALKAAPLKLLAEELNARGVATVRVDKRGVYASGGGGDANTATIEDLGLDARTWIHTLRAQLGAPCIWIAGHSEGGDVAIAAAMDGREICGLILISTPGRPLFELIQEQIDRAPGAAPLAPASNAILDKLRSGEHVPAAEIPNPLMALYAPAVQDKLIADFRFNPAETLARYRGPVMLVQGDADLQVSRQDADRLQAARPDAKLLTVPSMNHVLKIAPADRRGNFSTYADPSLPLAPGLSDAISAFVKTHGKL